jgi:outer membrane receptor protein involved in Fe transport
MTQSIRTSIRISVVASFSILGAVHVAQTEAAESAATPADAPPATAPAAQAQSSGDLDEIVVNGIKRGELIMPTTVTSDSAYGLDLGVMDTPRNNTVLSKVQLDALDIQNPGGFSYLTASAYSDASFGQPNVPKIRGQFADMFYNGMRDSFTLNGYGAPISFNMVDSIDIVKGPASVQGGAGAGVGGSIDITTKMPSMSKFAATFNLEADNFQKRIAGFDVGGPLASNVAGRVSFTSNDSGSYYNDMYFHQQSIYAAVVIDVTPNYTVSLNGDFADTKYRENDGANRVNQLNIDNGTYLTGGPVSPIAGFGTEIDLTGTTVLNGRTIIDEPAGNGAHSQHAMLQLIQTLKVTDNFSIVNNTFYDYMNRYNQVEAYYADTAIGSYTLENKTDFKIKFATGFVNNDVDAGFTYRYAHVDDIQNFANEPVSVYDLSANPNTWVFPANGPNPSNQLYGGAIPYTAAFGHQQYGVPGTYTAYANGTIDSNLQDAAIFLEHRLQFSPEWSVLYGLRGDLVQLNDSDPLYAAGLADGDGPYPGCGTFCITTPPSQHTSWYGLYNGNISVVYSPTSAISGYLTYNKAQYVYANANDGAVGTLGVDPTTQLRQNTLLEEAGMKFDLLGKALFMSIAGFRQERAEPSGQGGLVQTLAHITGAEIELNYQPSSNFFATASYSFLHTLTDTPFTFWNFPAQPGINYDGAGEEVQWQTCKVSGNSSCTQKFPLPGVPKNLFNVLANYKLDSGLGFQANLQITSPIQTTQAGFIDIGATNAAASFLTPTLVGPGGLISNAVVAANGYYTPPTIPWQYTLNAGVFYNFFEHYSAKFEIYNLTDNRNLLNDQGFYGNDFLTRQPPRSYDLTFTGKF